MYNLEGKVQKDLANVEKTFIVPNNCVVVCPWIIRNGFQNISENGYLPANADPYWYGFFQKIFTGNQVITATWEDSTYLTKVENAYKFQYNFQVGKYYQGAVIVGSAEYSTEIEPMTGNEDFLAMKNSSSVVIRFENWVPSEKDMYKLYTIPDLYGGKWYYISNVKALNDLQPKITSADETIYNDTSLPACEVTFTSLVDKLQVSGKAVEQYVQYAGIGEPYAIPLVSEYNSNTGTENQWIEPTKQVSYIPYQPQSANYLQVELQGANAFSAVEVEGRVLTYENNKWTSTPWKRLLAHNTVANQVNELNRTSLPSRNFYFFPDETLSFITSKTFQEDNKTREDALAMNQSAGKLSMGNLTNWNDETGLKNGLHISNPTTADGTHYDYNNQNWHPISYFGQDYERDTNGNFYAVNNITIKQNDSFVDILNKQSFIYETQPIIPLGFVSSKPYHISAIPIIGKIVSKFWGDMTINPNTTQRKPISIGYFMDCDVAGMVANIYSSRQDDLVWSPLSALVGDETKASKYLGTTALNTTLTFSLTDKVSENGTVYDTIYFGQKKKEDGTTDILSGGATYYYGRDNQITQPKNDSDIFVIDSITVYSLHKGKIKLTAFSDLSNPIWTTTIQSKANWTNSIRDWATTISTGGWGEDYCNWTINDWPWPERPDKIVGTEISINHDNNWLFQTSIHGDRTSISENRVWKNDFVSWSKYDQRDTHYAGAKANLDTRTTTVSTSYTDLNVGISTKSQFKQYFKEMVLFVSGNINANGITPLETKQTEINIPLTSSDTYTGTYIVGQLGDQVTGTTYTRLAVNDSDTAKQKMKQVIGITPYGPSTTGGISTLITYTITLNDSNISITINENDYANGWGIQQTTTQQLYFGDGVQKYMNEGGSTTYWEIANNQISTNVKVPKLRLVENDEKLKWYSIGTETISKPTGTTWTDTSYYEAKLIGESVSWTDIHLQNAPAGVSLIQGSTSNKAVLHLDGSTPVGTYELYVYCVKTIEGKEYTISRNVHLTITSTDVWEIRNDTSCYYGAGDDKRRYGICGIHLYKNGEIITTQHSDWSISQSQYFKLGSNSIGDWGITWKDGFVYTTDVSETITITCNYGGTVRTKQALIWIRHY